MAIVGGFSDLYSGSLDPNFANEAVAWTLSLV